jgi:hypothetical protein
MTGIWKRKKRSWRSPPPETPGETQTVGEKAREFLYGFILGILFYFVLSNLPL